MLDFVTKTSASRFLIGPGASQSDVVAMTMLLSSSIWPSRPQLRRASRGKLHDRYVVGEISVHTLGTSVNAVGRNSTTLLMPLPELVADHIRDQMDELWAEAEALAITDDPDPA